MDSSTQTRSLAGQVISTIETENEGFPGVVELFRSGFGWQSDISRRLEATDILGNPRYPLQRTEKEYYLDTQNEVLIFLAGPSIVHESGPRSLNQKRANRRLYHLAVLSRVAAEAILSQPTNTFLPTLLDDFEKSYKVCQEGIHSRYPYCNLESNVATLMSKTVALAGALADLEDPTDTSSANRSDYRREPYNPDEGSSFNNPGPDAGQRVKAGLLGGFTDAEYLVPESRGDRQSSKSSRGLRGLWESMKHQ